MLFKSNDTVFDYAPEGEKFTKTELEKAVGGDFYFVVSDNKEHLFVVNRKFQTEALSYNMNANYLYRRMVENGKVLRGNVLLCHHTFFEGAAIALYTFKQTHEDLNKNIV